MKNPMDEIESWLKDAAKVTDLDTGKIAKYRTYCEELVDKPPAESESNDTGACSSETDAKE